MEFLRSLLRCHFAWKPVGWRREMSVVLRAQAMRYQSFRQHITTCTYGKIGQEKYRILFEIYIYIYLADFFKTNLTKSAVIWVKSCQNAGFLRPISSKITPTKEKERRKSKSKERERRRREKTMVALLVFIMDTFFGRKKKLLDGRGLFGDNVFKNPVRYILRS